MTCPSPPGWPGSSPPRALLVFLLCAGEARPRAAVVSSSWPLPPPRGSLPSRLTCGQVNRRRFCTQGLVASSVCSTPMAPKVLMPAPVCVSAEPSLEPRREAPVRPPGSSGSSGDGGWGPASNQSSPSTPSPPLPPEAAHFLFGEPALRKRKVSQGSPWSGVDVGGAEADRPLSPRARCRGCSSVCGSAAGRC